MVFERSECTHCVQALQDGMHSSSEGSLTRRGLHGEVRPERRISVCSSPLPAQVYSSLEVQNPAIRTEQCSIHIHKADQANSGNLEKAGDSSHPLPGRHVDNGNHPEVSNETYLLIYLLT